QCCSQAIARPQGARFKRGDQLLGETVAADPLKADARTQSSKQAALRCDHRRDDLIAEALAQHRAQFADCISKPKLDRRAAGPVLAGEQVSLGTCETGPTALLHQRDEVIMDLTLDQPEPLDLISLFRQERIEHRLALARRIDAALDAEFLQEPWKSERDAEASDLAH